MGCTERHLELCYGALEKTKSFGDDRVQGRDDVRTFFENLGNEIEIPIYDPPAHLRPEDSKS